MEEGDGVRVSLQMVGAGDCSPGDASLEVTTIMLNTPVPLQSPQKKEEEDNIEVIEVKKLASDPDFCTPKRMGEGDIHANITNSGAKKRLNFDRVAGDEGDISCPSSSDGPHHHHHHKKKRKRSHRPIFVDQGNQPPRKIMASSSIANTIPSAEVDGKKEGPELGDEEEGKEGGADKENKAPPRRIAQLVVWTKHLKGGKGGEQTQAKDSQPAVGQQRKAVKPVEKKQEPPKEEAVEKKGKEEKEDDLFFVQYPARPFSDQGKGKGKPFRRLNSYNDPIVIKKTPPPPPAPQPKRKIQERKKRGGGNKRGRQDYPPQQHLLSHPLLPPQVVTDAVYYNSQPTAYGAYLPYISTAPPHLQIQGVDYNVAQFWPVPAEVSQYPHQVPSAGHFVSAEEYYQCSVPQYHPGSLGEVITLSGYPAPPNTATEVVLPLPPTPAEFPEGEYFTGKTEEVAPTNPTAHKEEMMMDTREVGGDNSVFELPDRFTVTTEGQNEFDLLIQNVVHEELVNGGCTNGEEECPESCRKRMRLDGEDPLLGGGEEEALSSGGEERGGTEEGKPRCTYTELIEKALTESGGLTVSEIYNWISERYPYYKQDDDRWKNSVRHNLSINPYFKKGEKARSGAGHLWTISEESKGLRPSMVSGWDERRKSPCDPGELMLSMDNETDRAVANILGMYRSKMAAEKGQKEDETGLNTPPGPPERKLSEEGETALPPPTTTPASTEVSICSSSGDSYCPNGVIPTTAATAPPAPTSIFSLNQLNTGQFTVDLSGISIPEGGTINFDELMSNGRLIYIETTSQSDPEANKENEQQTGLLQTDSLLSELSGGATSSNLGEDPNRFLNGPPSGSNFYQDLDLGGAFKGDHSSLHFGCSDDYSEATSTGVVTTTSPSLTMVAPSDVVPVSTSSSSEFSLLDALHPLTSSTGFDDSHMPPPDTQPLHHHLSSSAAIYESKELGIPYTFQTEHPPAHHLL